MFLLIEILDGTNPSELIRSTPVDLRAFNNINDAIIFAEPHYMIDEDKDACVIVSKSGEFGIVPKATDKFLPELVRKWIDVELAEYFFERAFETSN